MSCMDDDMFPSHDRVEFDPSFLLAHYDEQHCDTASTAASDSLDSHLSTSSSLSSALKMAVSPFAPSSPCSPRALSRASSDMCEHSPALEEHKAAIAHLQQDVAALRLLMSSEMSRMKQEMKLSMQQMEQRIMDACKKQLSSCAAPSPTLHLTTACVSEQPTVLAAPAAMSPRDMAASLRRGMMGSDFCDSGCGDDYTAPHPSEFEEKEQEAFHAAMQEKLAEEASKDKAAVKEDVPPAAAQPADEQPQPATAPAVAAAVPATPAKSSSASATALSITSLTALINPAGLPLTEPQLITLACRILSDHGSVPVGKMGSLLHKAANDHTLPALLKERYGGLKKFLQAQSKYFMLGNDHPYNPHVALVGQQQLPVPAAVPAPSSLMSSSGPASSSPLAAAMVDPHSLSQAHGHDMRGQLAGSWGSAEYGRAMDSDDALFNPYQSAQRKATASALHTPTATRGSTFSALPSYTSRLQDALHPQSAASASTSSDMHSLALQMDRLLTDVVSLDCEMVGCGIDGQRSVLARASIVNYHGTTLYDCFVQPPDGELVTDYRTHVSGIRPGDLDPPRAIPFVKAQQEVANLLQGRTVVAHSVINDLQALQLQHPLHLLRDTALFPLLCPDRPQRLRTLVVERLGWTDFQMGEHDSVEDARAVMCLYRSVEHEWETAIKTEQAADEQEKKAIAARSAASARHRALVLDQQQQQHGYSAFGLPLPRNGTSHSSSPSSSGLNGSLYVGGASQSYGNAAVTGGRSIHSTLWR